MTIKEIYIADTRECRKYQKDMIIVRTVKQIKMELFSLFVEAINVPKKEQYKEAIINELRCFKENDS